MNRILLAMLLALGAHVGFAATKEEDFTRSVLAKLQVAVPGHKFEYAAPLEIRDATNGNSIYLDRIHGFATSNPRQANAAIESFVARVGQLTLEADKPLSVTSLRLAVRHSASIKQAMEALGSGTKAAYPRDLAGDLVVVPVVDTPSTVKYLSEGDLLKLGLNEAEVLKLAGENLRKSQKPLEQVAKVPAKNGLGTIQEEYAASRLIFVSDWAALEKKLGGSLIVMAPSYDTVIYGDGSTARAIDALRTLGLQVAKRSQTPLSATILRFKGDRWEPVP